MRTADIQNELRHFLRRDGCPATITILALSVVSWFLDILMGPHSPVPYLAFLGNTWPWPCPWSPVTWPIAEFAGNPLSALFGVMWFFMIGGSLERSWGTKTFLSFLGATSALTAMTYFIGCRLMHTPCIVAGLWMASAPPTIAWCLMNRRETVMISYFIPVKAIWLAWLTAALVWWGMGAPIQGFFALSGCAAAWWYVTNGRYPSSGSFLDRLRNRGFTQGDPPRERNDRFRNFDREVSDNQRNPTDILGRLRDQKEKRRRDKQLEDMFRRSGFDESGDDDRRK